MSQIGGPRENPKIQEPSAEREDFLDDGVSDIENSVESYIRDLKKLILIHGGMIETLQTDIGKEIYKFINSISERIVLKLESITEEDFRKASILDTVSIVEDFIIDQDALICIFNNTDDYTEEDVFMNLETMREAYAEL